MKLTLRQQLTQFAHTLQSRLFPVLEEEMGELDGRAKQLVATLEMIPLARFLPSSHGWIGRPSKDRYCIACAFVAKACTDSASPGSCWNACSRMRSCGGFVAVRAVAARSSN